MTEQVIYELGLRDRMSAGIQGADGHVNKLERSLGGVRNMLNSVKSSLGLLGVGFAVFKGVEFIHEGIEAVEKLHQSEAQVLAGLKSTNEAAGISFEDLEKSAKSLSAGVKYSRSEIFDLQSLLLTFPLITKQSFEPAEQTIIDMSTRLGTDLKSSAIQVGKALQDPVRGITALRRVGVNFNDQQKETIANFVKTNQLAKAQSLILNELTMEFGGSAKAAFDADPLSQYNKTMGSLKLTMGELAMDILKELLPTLQKFANWLKSAFEWIKKNREEIKRLITALGTAWLAFKAGAFVIPLIEGIAGAMAAAAAGGIPAFGAAIAAAMGPVGLLITAATTAIYLINKLADLKNAGTEKGEQRGVALDEAAKSETEDLEKMISGKKGKEVIAILDLEIRKRRELSNSIRDQSNAAANDYARYDLYDKAQQEVMRTNTAIDFKKNLISNKGKIPTAVAAGSKATDSKTKATGSKSVTINVTIQKLGETIINTTNIKEGAKQLHDHVVKALTSAVNDFQVVAQNS